MFFFYFILFHLRGNGSLTVHSIFQGLSPHSLMQMFVNLHVSRKQTFFFVCIVLISSRIKSLNTKYVWCNTFSEGNFTVDKFTSIIAISELSYYV